jgi:nickel superoxide dismutase
MKKTIFMTVFLLFTFDMGQNAFSHCQIPCGIYDDQARFTMIEENILTIEKSMKQIVELSNQSDKNFNQIVRWTLNKENHADEIAHIVSYYFLAQRVKPADNKDTKAHTEYLAKITVLHEMIIQAMKAKQTTDLAQPEKLRSLLKVFHKLYFRKEAAEHSH